jgi:hypothetical protein
MRRLGLTILLLPWILAAPAAQAPPDAAKLPAKGDEVLARGCVDGSMFRARETRRTGDEIGRAAESITFRLTGPRAVLRALRTDHAGVIVNVQGTLKSHLPSGPGGTRGTEIGKTGIFIGMGTPARGNSPGDQIAYVPVLEVKSFEVLGVPCGR